MELRPNVKANAQLGHKDARGESKPESESASSADLASVNRRQVLKIGGAVLASGIATHKAVRPAPKRPAPRK